MAQKAVAKKSRAKKAGAKKPLTDLKHPVDKKTGIPIFLLRNVKGEPVDLETHDGVLYKVSKKDRKKWWFAVDNKPVPKTKIPKNGK